MKCLNPECPDPSLVESLPVKLNIEYCPKCGSSLKPALKSSDSNSEKSEKPSQIGEERSNQSSLKPNGNETTVVETGSSPLSESNGRGKELVGSSSANSDTWNQEEADPPDNNKPIPPDNGSIYKDNESQQATVVEDEAKEDKGPEKGKDTKDGKGPEKGKDTKDGKGPEKGKDTKEDKGTEKGKDTKEDNGPEKGKDTEEDKGTEKGKDTKEDNGPEKGKDTKDGKGPEKGKDTKKGKGPEKGKDTKDGKGSEKGKDTKDGKGPEKGKDTKEDKGTEKGKDTKEDNGPEKGKDTEEDKGTEKGKDTKEDNGPEKGKDTKEGKSPEKGKDTKKGKGPEKGKDTKDGKGPEKGKDTKKGKGPEKGKDTKDGKGPEKGKDTKEGKSPEKGKDTKEGKSPEKGKDTKEGKSPEKGKDTKKGKGPEKGKDTKEGKSPEKGKDTKKGKGPEKGKDTKEGKSPEKGKDTKEGKSPEKGKDTKKGKGPEKGKDTKEGKSPEKGKDTKEGKSPEKGKDTKEGKSPEKGKDTKKGKGPEKGKDTKEGKSPEKGKDTKEGKGPERGKDTKKGKGPEKGKDTKEGKGPEKGKDTKEGKGPEKGKDSKEDEGTENSKDTKDSKGPEKGKDTKEGKSPEKGKDTKKGKGPEKGKDAKEGKSPEKGKDTKEGKGPERGKDTKKGKGPEKGKDTKEGKGPEKGKDTKEGKGPEKGKDSKEDEGTENSKDTKDSKGPEKGKDTKEGKGPENGKDTKEDEGTEKGKDSKEDEGTEKGKDTKEDKGTEKGKDTKEDEGTEKGKDTKEGKGPEKGKDTKDSKGPEKGKDTKEDEGTEKGKDTKDSKDPEKGKDTKEDKGTENGKDTKEDECTEKGKDTKDNKGPEKGKDTKEDKGTEKGKDTKDGKGPEKGKDTKEDKGTEKGKDTKEDKGPEKGKDTKDGKGPEKGKDTKEDRESFETTNGEDRSSSDDKKMTVVFHALLAPHFQCDPERQDRVVVRGGKPHFNGWEEDAFEMDIIKREDGYIVIEGGTTILLKDARELITYKYLVFKKDENKKMWEELIDCHADNKAHVNRCFLIPEQKREAKGVWHQYDDAVFSQPNTLESIRNKLPYLKAMNPCEGRELAIQAVLPDWDCFGLDKTSGNRKREEIMATINQVEHCMENLKAEINGDTVSRKLDGFSWERVLLSYIKPRLKKNYELAQSMNDDTNIQANRLATSVAIAEVAFSFVRKFSIHLSQALLKEMFECLALNASLDRPKIESIMKILAEYYPGESLKKSSEAIFELCQYAINHYPDVYQWLLAVPLMHFVGEESRPYTETSSLCEPSLQDASCWGTSGLNVAKIQSSSWKPPDKFLNRLKKMFEIDPLLRRTFLFALPLSDFGRCVAKGSFLSCEVIWTLAYKLLNIDYYDDEKKRSVKTCLDFMIKLLDSENKGILSSAKGSLKVLDCLLIPPSLNNMLDLACSVLRLLSKCLCLLIKSAGSTMSGSSQDEKTSADQAEDSNTCQCANVWKEATEKVQNKLSNSFSRNLGVSHDHYKNQELKIWSAFLHVEFSDDTLQTSWRTKLLEGLTARADKMNDMQKIKCYSTTNLKDLHEDVERCFQKAAFDAITRIIGDGRAAEHVKAFDSLREHDPNSSQSRQVGEMMSLLLKRCWPEDTEQEGALLTHVLTWGPMANYLQYFRKSSKTLSEDSQVLLARTKSCLEDIYRNVSDASVTVNSLRIIRDKEEKYCELIDIIGDSVNDSGNEEREGETDDKQGDAHKGSGKIYRKAQAILQKRLDELAAFDEEREQLRSFLGISSILQHVDVDDMKAKAYADVSQKVITDLAVHIGGEEGGQTQVQVTFFGLSKELKTMVTTMHRIHDSRIFVDIWRKTFQNAQHDEQTMKLEVVVQHVWFPTFMKCKDILQAVLTGDITLGDIDESFQGFKGRCVDLERDLCIIMGACRTTVDSEGIRTQVGQIQKYHRLSNCITAAEKILEFADNMSLDGDFDMVKNFRLQESQVSKKDPLKSLREKFGDQTGGILEEFTFERLECLDAVMESMEFIDWIKDSVPDPNELKVLVDLVSAGEGDMEIDRIAALYTCTKGFKPLIYDLKKDAGFERLAELCREVWKNLKHNPRLPVQMTDTKRRLEWLKDVLVTHGSVTMSSLKKLETIIKHGTLTIGCHGNSEEINTIDTVISLKLPKDKIKGLQKEIYNLEDLKDLQGKLMLIAGKSAGQEHVHKFTEMLQGAISLGTVYNTLCETGEVSHLNWEKVFECRGKNVIKELQDDYDEFNKFLKAWTKILNYQRIECKELNYFTAKQLVYMRKEVAKLRKGREFANIDVQLYTLLDSVLPGVNARSLQKALIAIGNQSPLEAAEEKTITDGNLRKHDQTLGELYLSLEELSTFLSCLAKDLTQEDQRTMTFPGYLMTGKPNLLLVPQRDILPTVLGLYMGSEGLPSRHEVLICTQDTTLEEVESLWRRILTNTSDKFYCLANADILSYNVSQQAVQTFYHLVDHEYPGSQDYKVVIICSNEQEVKSHIVSALDEYRVAGVPPCPSPSEVTEYLQKQFVAPKPQTVDYQGRLIKWIPAAEVESQDRLSVRVISSDRAGTGKSLIVQDYSKRLDSITNNSTVTKLLEEQEEHVPSYVIVPLHGKTANLSDTVSFLLPYSLKTDVPISRIFHIDVSPSVEHGFDTLLFNLLVLGSIQDNRGRIWKRNPRDLYIVEVIASSWHDTPPTGGTDKYARLHNFYQFLPYMRCMTPTKALQEMSKDTATDNGMASFNEGQFQSEPFQRVYQYLQRYDTKPELLHKFQFNSKKLAEGATKCLQLLIKYCGVNDPSWAELRHFVDFLNYQLKDCERSDFCQMENVADTLEGFRLFVVRFMTLMAQDFSTRSLSDRVDDENTHDDETQDIIQFQLRRRWESSFHPYMFFNTDHQTFTFLGFRLDPYGNLINPSTGEMIQKHLMTKGLRDGLDLQKVNFDEDFERLNKEDKIQKICAVLGVECPRDPDESYELTEDNAKKILAIHMRFRCGIPVVVMGETGCGKTKLIRYLCGLQKGFQERKNMLLVKVHGGTSFQDIERKVKQAQQMAKENSKNNVETILFFDEVNTTEALDLVKEIMVDRRLNGRPLGSEDDRLRFIAACNPYRKHTDTMIKKLESAGLGYSVKTGDTTERIGCLPLRHLVYRVHALPDSMISLIWDFGQLKPEVELLYTRQIVLRHVITENRIPGDISLVNAITHVLAASQQYMRNQTDECSFVSLRDVERTMNVMVWFYEHKDVFGPLFEKIAKQEDNNTNRRRTDDDDKEEEEEKPGVDEGDDDNKDEDDSDNDESVLTWKSDDDEKTPFIKKRRLVLDFFRRIRQEQEPIESNLIPSGISMPAASSHSKLPHAFPTFGNESDDEDLDTRDETQEQEQEEDLDDPTKLLDPVTWSLILAIGVCYHARLQDRQQYRQKIAKTFKRPCVLYGGADRILQEITGCQNAVLEKLDTGPNIARNTALSENVFMMVVCIELRIPLFIIGKPGSSKSLAKTVVLDNMQGDASKSQLFKSFKEVQMLSHQCSPLSTPEGIQETFRKCANIQKDKNPDKFVSVVVLDEVGLAEDSPLMPLKTLHPLLEDGVTPSDDIIETDEKPTQVAFIGISNWALDPAKMNRGIMLSRDVPDEGELKHSAMGICASNKEVQELMVPIIPALAAAYSELYEQQKDIKVLKEANKDEFFGLRDFYSLIKMLRVIAEERNRVPDWRDVEYAVRRNFGGLDVEELNPVEIFMKHLNVDEHVRKEDQHQTRDVSPIKLIKSSLEKDPSEKNSRYLLILTENHAALGIVEQLLKQIKEEKSEDLDAVLIFGSSFPKDLEYTQVCRNINDIKVCMETGRTVILLNMESLYEGLYDALNQCYVYFGGKRYVDLGLGTHRVKCRVHENFRLIVIAEKDTVHKKFPIPLINRLEKHFLVFSTSLTRPQENLVMVLKEWVRRFSTIKLPGYRGNKKKFTEDDAFIGYHDDTLPSVVLQVCSQLQQDGTAIDDKEKEQWEEKVLWECKRRLVRCCPPDAIVRLHYSELQHEADQLWDLYFKQQQHSSLASFVSYVDRRYHQDGLLIQVSTHSKLLSEQNLKEVGKAFNLHHQAISCITLQQFQTEQQFCDSVGTFFAKQGGEECLLIVQCNTEDLTFNLLACARHHLLKERSKITEEIPEGAQPIHIIVIIQLPKMFGRYPDFVGFQGQRWKSVHIEELFTPSFYVLSLESVKGHSLSDLFGKSIDMCFSKTDKEEQVLAAVDVVRQSVQAAAGRIEDGQETVARATKRIVILLNLLAKDRSEELDENSFSHVLLRRVHHLLKEKDASAPKEGVEWSTSEALESSELQESGTYRKALWRRIQNAVVPILSEVIAYMDKGGNLDLLHTDVPWIKELWIKFFADDKLTQLNYDSFLTNDRRLKSQVRVTSSGRDSHWFRCQLPFSWLLKEKIDCMWLQAKNVSENSSESIQDCFQTFAASSIVADEIKVIEGKQEAMERYIHDFVHMNCKPVDKGEDELISRALVVEARHQHALSPSHENDFKFPDIALVHKAYSHIEHRIACFSQLVQCIPSIVPKLLEFFTLEENEMILDVMALQMCLESLEPLKRSLKDSADKRRQWCDEVFAVRATAEKIFGEKCQLEDEEKRMGIIKCCRPLWERLTAVRLFIDHVYLSTKEGIKPDPENIIKLCKVLDETTTDFSSASSIEAVGRFLVKCIEGFKTSSSQTAIDFRQCNSFFMELISLLCFGGDGHRNSLEPEVFKIFMRCITENSLSQATKEFSPFPDFEVDKTPVVRSFLLQQLLTISFDKATEYLQQYLSDAQALSPDRHHVMRVCQLVADCIEDSTSSKLSQEKLSDLIKCATGLIRKESDILQTRNSNTNTLEALKAIAVVRYVLSLTAELLFKSCKSSEARLQVPDVASELKTFLNVVQEICVEMPDRAPLMYLLKQLTRRYGASAINDLTQDRYPEMTWLIPREFKKKQINADGFVVYEEYTNVRDALARLLSGNSAKLSVLTQVRGLGMTNFKTRMDVLCLLSIYREVTCGYREPSHQVLPEHQLHQIFGKNCSPEVLQLANQLLRNTHGMGFTALSVHPAQPRDTVNLAELVVHTMVVLQCSNDNKFVRTLKALLMDPGSMKDSFLPTMPEDDFHQVLMGLTEPNKWYKCPKGHRYSIGDCGGATQASVCPECKSAIGGTAYRLLPGNAPLHEQTEDRSNRGHILGNAKMIQTSSVQPERNLSPAVVHLIRLIMHSAMLVGACRHPQESSQIFSPPVEPGRLKQFLWEHLTRGLHCLAAALNRNEDEALLTVHLVLAQITGDHTHDGPLLTWFPVTADLKSSRDRRQWEQNFTSSFIDPVLSRLDEHLQTCFNVMTSDSRVGTDHLMREIYEVDTLDAEQEKEDEEEAFCPMKRCFWRYRPSITLEHAKQRFSEEMKSDEKIQQCKVLQTFFKEDYRLRVVRYLPNINKLHKLLTDRLYQRINQKQASEMKVKEFEAKLKGSEKEEFKELFGSFKDAWAIVRECLDKLGRYKLSGEELSMTIDDNSPLSILIPSSDGLGRCSLALVFYLVTAHNEFMETYFNIIMGKASQVNKISLPEVTSSQLVSYDTDRDLLPLIKAHCHYSFEVGHGTLVEYDWPAIQRQLIDRFIRGKILVEFEEPKFFLRKNNEDMFIDVRSKIEQKNISPTSTRMITTELGQLDEVCEVKLSLEIAIGFLSSSGGQPEQFISEYLHDVLRMPKENGLKSRRAEQYCQLKHIIHLWQLVTTQRANILLKKGQDPFDKVPDCFKEDIPRHGDVNVLLGLNKSLSTIDCKRFCGELLEMIIFSLNEEYEEHENAMLKEFFEHHMGKREGTDVSGLPENLLLKHAVETWKNVLEKSERSLSSEL